MKGASGKSHLLICCSEPFTVVIDGTSIESNIKEVLLGITIDRNLKFYDHVNNFCKKACHKLNVVSCLAPFMNVNKRRMIMKAFTDLNSDTAP